MPVSVQLLQQFPLLSPLQAPELVALSTGLTLHQYARREVVLAKDDASRGLGFLVEGRLQGVDFTVDGRSVGLYFVDPGDYFGELPVIDEQKPSEHIVAAVKSTVAFWPAALARETILNHPELARKVLLRLAQRVRSVMAQRTLLSLPNPFQRLCALLLQLPGTEKPQGREIEQAPTHLELAIMINASRETVTRAFQVLLLHGLLSRDGHNLLLLKVQDLQLIADGRMDPPRQ